MNNLCQETMLKIKTLISMSCMFQFYKIALIMMKNNPRYLEIHQDY